MYRTAQHCSLPLFSEYAFQQLKKHVHFDSAGIADCSIGPTNRILMQTVQLHATTLDRFHDRTDVVGSEALGTNGAINSRDVLLQAAFLNRGQSAIVDIARTFSDPVVLDYCRRYDTAHALAFIDGNVKSREFCGVSLWRADKRRPFTPIEGETASRLLSHLVLARTMNQRLHAQAELTSSAHVHCSADGQLFLVNQAAIDLLQLEWKEWRSPFLPAQLILALRQSREKAYYGHSITVRAKLDGEILNLAITRNTPPAGLTSAEWRVAVLAMEGRRYKEIGRQLGISPATVRNQLHAIYRKLNVSNKTAIAGALTPHGTNVP